MQQVSVPKHLGSLFSWQMDGGSCFFVAQQNKEGNTAMFQLGKGHLPPTTYGFRKDKKKHIRDFLD